MKVLEAVDRLKELDEQIEVLDIVLNSEKVLIPHNKEIVKNIRAAIVADREQLFDRLDKMSLMTMR